MSDYHINIFFRDEDQCYIADIPDLRMCSGLGGTPEAALREALIAKQLFLEASREQGRPIPEPKYRPVGYEFLDRPLKQLMTTKEAAIYLGVDASRVRQMILGGQLAAEKGGRDWWIREEDLEKVKKRPVGYPKGRSRERAVG